MTCAESGHWLLASWPRFNKSLPIGPYRESQDLFLADSNGIVVKALGSVLATERYRHERSDGPRTFGKVTVMATNQGRLYIGDGEESVLVVRSLQSGASLLDLRYDSPKIPVTQSDVARHLEDHLATVRSPSHREAQRRASATYGYPEFFPPYGSLMVRHEQVWIADYPTPERTSEAWTVFDHSGQVVGRVVLPRGFELLDVGARHGIVRWTAEDGSQEPRVYPLRRQTRSK